MNKKYIIIFLIVMIVVSGFVYAGDNNFDARELGKHVKKVFMNKSQERDDVLCYVDDIEISEEKFKIFKETSLFYNKDISEEALLKKYIQFVLLINEAEEEGFTISKQENEEYTNELFNALENDDENMKILKEYIDGLGITMDEYKERVKEFNYKILLTMKLQDKLKTEFLQNNEKTMVNSTELNIEFNNYLNNYKEEIYNNAEKIMNNK